MGLLGGIGKKLGLGGDSIKLLETVEEHPEYLAALGGGGLAAAGVNALFPGMSLNRPGFGIGEALMHPLGRGNKFLKPAARPAGYGPSKMFPVASVAAGLGTTLQGIQPFSVAGYYELVASSNVTKNVNIVDMFAASVTPAFSNDNTFPWPFQAYAMRWAIVSAPQAAGKEDLAWQETIHVVFSVATEIARVNIEALGLRCYVNGLTSSGAAAMAIDEQPSSAWAVYYEKNGTYSMSLRSDTALSSTNANLAVAYAMDGWVINDTSLDDMESNQIIAQIEGLLRSHSNIGETAELKAAAQHLASADHFTLANMAAGRFQLPFGRI